jgi:hypothetical protein
MRAELRAKEEDDTEIYFHRIVKGVNVSTEVRTAQRSRVRGPEIGTDQINSTVDRLENFQVSGKLYCTLGDESDHLEGSQQKSSAEARAKVRGTSGARRFFAHFFR